MLKDFARSVLIALLSAMVFAGPAAKIARAQAVQGYPLTANNFVETTPHGFGDFNNSWAQAMVWWNNNLYVGTSRDSLCASLEGVHLEGIALLGLALANQYLPYPPPDPNLTCTPDPADLPLAAQIWQWSPGTNAWTQVYDPRDAAESGPRTTGPAGDGQVSALRSFIPRLCPLCRERWNSGPLRLWRQQHSLVGLNQVAAAANSAHH